MPNLSIGIIGLPNVGKSTLFRALTSVAVPTENYPFCTIDPNVGVVEVPDPRLDRLAELAAPRRPIPPVVEFVDIAGLVRGASRGEGLGNRFLHHVREADALAHVLRVFEDERVVRPAVSSGPLEDLETVETELALADLEVVSRRLERVEKRARTGDHDAAAEADLLRRIERRLDGGEPARREPLEEAERGALRSLNLLTLKPSMYVLNVDEAGVGRETREERRLREAIHGRYPEAPVLSIAARLEAEVAELAPEERRDYLKALGLPESGLDRLIRAGYRLLGLETFFTIGDDEVRAWTIRRGARAPEAAGTVHTDFSKGFIRAETIPFEEFERAGSMREARGRGMVRSEGKEYVVQDGDILLFRTGA